MIKPDLVIDMWSSIVSLPHTFEKVENADLLDQDAVGNIEVAKNEWELSLADDKEEEKYSWFASFFGFSREKENTLISGENTPLTIEKPAEIISTHNQSASDFSADENALSADKGIVEENLISSGTVSTLDDKSSLSVEKNQEKLLSTSDSISSHQFIKDELVLDPAEYTVEINHKGMIVIKARDDVEPSTTSEIKKQDLLPSTIKTEHVNVQKGLSAQDLREADELFNL